MNKYYKYNEKKKHLKIFKFPLEEDDLRGLNCKKISVPFCVLKEKEFINTILIPLLVILKGKLVFYYE